MSSHFTLSIFNLGEAVTVLDVQQHLRETLQLTQSLHISPLVSYKEQGYQGTIVSFIYSDSDQARKDAVERLKDSRLKDKHGNYSTVHVSSTFYGLTILAENHPQPSFDVVFVHGLNGHAFKSFCSTPKNGIPYMWGRDLLPNRLLQYRLFGRFLTFGYNAKVSTITGEREESVEQVAEELLSSIVDSRPRVS